MTDEDKPKRRENPDKDCRVAVEPHDPEAARSDAQAGLAAHAVGFNPSRPVATSPPPTSMLTGVPDLPLLNDRERAAQAAAATGGGATGATEPVAESGGDPKSDSGSKAASGKDK